MVGLNRVLSAAVVGAVAMTASSPAYAQSTRTPVLQTASVAPGIVTGVVRDERGAGVTGAMVSLSGLVTAMTVSDEQGRFVVEKLPQGEYVLRAHLAGFSASPRQIVQVGSGQARFTLQMRRLDAPVGTAGEGRTPIASRPIMAAGFDLPRPESQDAAARPDDAAAGQHPHSETAWRLRHIKRSILKGTIERVDVGTAEGEADLPSGSRFARANSFATSIFADLPLSGEVNLLTTSSMATDMWGAELPRGVAYFSLGAPTPAGNWLVRGAMSQGDLSSWIVAGSFLSNRDAVHTYEVGLTYSTQEYAGGNPVALAAVRDGSRNVGEVRVMDRWALSPGLTFEYGGRYARHDYLEDRGLLSPTVGFTLEPAKGTRIRAVLAQRMVAPGAEEFLTSTITGPWLPPERTFAPLGAADTMRAERARGLDVLVEHEFSGTYVLGVRRFFQEVDGQLVTMFGLGLPEGPSSVGHYYVGNAGSVDAQGWGFRVASPNGARVRAAVDYSITRAHWMDRGDIDAILRWAPATIRAERESIHDVTASVDADFPETATRLFVLYKVNSAFTRAGGQPGTDGRFALQVHQALPFDVAGTRWEVLVGVRNLFRDPGDPASAYDELLVVRPPKRVIGGFLVRF